MGSSGKQKVVTWTPVNKPLKRVQKCLIIQIESCPVESVYDLREDGDSRDVYDDATAFRRPRSNSSDFLILRKTSRPISVDVVGLVDDNLDPYKQYMKVVDCYELAPHAGSVVLLDGKVKLQKAFKVLIEWGVGSAVVWSSKLQRVTSLLCLTDFLNTLLSDSSEESTPVEQAVSSNQLVWLSASCKLLEACHEFCSNRVHRIVIFDQAGDVFYLLTIKRILQAVHKQVRENDSLETAARKMLDFRISSVPILDSEDRPVDVISKTDIAYALADVKNFKEQFRRLTTVDAVRNRQPIIFPSETDTVGRILDFALSRKNCRCVFVIDVASGKLSGAISLSDFISYILYHQLSSLPSD
ncbi:unnamed protein product [Gongylonema pulchrum]|uniref:CBS domain-containing protein n=1 Tax=Gongylonema pulchrum TaxID=637853 RepID=A0A183DW79_9BILA|nr:unnamed protein product [Gongylonema pulchrum]